ncbi:alcohol dehydrogenase GroES domain protein [Irpex rosettiformis]|uniref:Alcohol dehydrogenase GroES domain protein n=1 Tax=Irpex rosettiformis TaxID=378272 RepID=A0ACB8U6J1_9APHY|nr:alcohol dehydrogenase GroES domain protein [Irpex rosettiformis]
MRAARYYGPGDVRVEEVPEPETRKGQVKIKLVCGSDLHAFHAPFPESITPTLTNPHYVTGETLPVTLGHEFSGIITEVGEGVDTGRLSKGQNVVVEPLISCRENGCGPCSADHRNVCPHASFLGLAGWGGGLAEYITVDERLVFPLPLNTPLDVGAMIEPLAVAWHAINRSAFKEGANCLVIGSGPIGLMTLKALQARGAKWIGVSEPSDQRRGMAVEQQASAVFDPRTQDVVAEVFKATGGQGADVVFDCAGVQPSLDLAAKAVRPRGNITIVAIWTKPAILNMNDITFKEFTMTGIIGYDHVHAELLEAVAAGKFTGLEKFITKKIKLEDVVEEGIKVLMNDKEQIKILVHP